MAFIYKSGLRKRLKDSTRCERQQLGTSLPSPPGIFVLHDGMGLVAKRLEHIPNSDPARVKIVSDNDRYAPYEGLIEEMNILGRIRWFAREI